MQAVLRVKGSQGNNSSTSGGLRLPTPAASQFERIVMPSGEPDQRIPGLRFGNPRVVALFAVLARFALAVDGFRAGDLQPQIADYLGQPYSLSTA